MEGLTTYFINNHRLPALLLLLLCYYCYVAMSPCRHGVVSRVQQLGE